MRKLDIPMLLLALTVIIMFSLVGVAIALRNIWFVLLFFILGFLIMGSGLSIKKKRK